MPFEMKNMRWSLFKNDRKAKETDPDYTGSGKVDDQEMWVNAWIEETKDGRKYFSGSFKFKEPRKDDPQRPLDQTNLRKELDDEIPF